MAFRALRRAPATTAAALSRPPATTATAAITRRQFHCTPRAFVKVGDPIPNLDVLAEDSPGNKVNLQAEFAKGNGIIVGVPAAFSPACSATHIPGYIKHPKLRDAGQVFVVSVNDAFVMKAWADQIDPLRESGIRYLADPTGEFTKELDLGFDLIPVFGNTRSKRCALVIKDGKVAEAHVEPDSTGTSVSLAENVLS